MKNKLFNSKFLLLNYHLDGSSLINMTEKDVAARRAVTVTTSAKQTVIDL
jgi:ATP-dependent Clp protease adapter protein ClpS